MAETDFEEDATPSPIRHDDMGFQSPPRGSPVKSNFEEIGSLGSNVETSFVDTTINQGDQAK